jgi:hypothetical protein
LLARCCTGAGFSAAERITVSAEKPVDIVGGYQFMPAGY